MGDRLVFNSQILTYLIRLGNYQWMNKNQITTMPRKNPKGSNACRWVCFTWWMKNGRARLRESGILRVLDPPEPKKKLRPQKFYALKKNHH